MGGSAHTALVTGPPFLWLSTGRPEAGVRKTLSPEVVARNSSVTAMVYCVLESHHAGPHADLHAAYPRRTPRF